MSRFKTLSSRNIVTSDRCTEPPAKLFRLLADKIIGCGENSEHRLSIWKSYLDDYIRKVHPDDPKNMDTVKKDRSTTIGNINDTLWMNPRLSFNKLITGLAILKCKKVKITITVETESGNEYSVEDVTLIPSVKAIKKR